ncbi:MAG: amino acid ABC transporter substrate-binding protein, partial [Chloroflexales bacterium]|nr:amino acid ABC transporter substrate-binding protein [Chloroflexales bacterium]
LGAGIGLPNDFGFQIISQVGNYADIYDRNLGPDTYFALERGANKVWNLGEGGVLESPPFR